jgi:hypothetical protein
MFCRFSRTVCYVILNCCNKLWSPQTCCCMICCLPPQNLFLSTSSLHFGSVFAHHRQVYVLSYKCHLLFLELPSLHIQFHACDMSGNRENHFYQGGTLNMYTHTHINLLAVIQMVIITVCKGKVHPRTGREGLEGVEV